MEEIEHVAGRPTPLHLYVADDGAQHPLVSIQPRVGPLGHGDEPNREGLGTSALIGRNGHTRPMDVETYFRDHWVDIEPARLDRYRRQFKITDANRPMLVDPLGAHPGETVLDFGCGPGYVAIELAKVVGPEGTVHALDLNPDLLAMGRELAAEAGVGDRIEFHHVTDATIPLDDATVDRVVFKSVLLYIPDVDLTMGEAFRVLRPGGVVATQDTDFWLSACAPFTREEWRAFLDATGPAFKDPTMGRNLPGALRRAGFGDITTTVSAMVDNRGGFRPVLENFIGYVREVGGMPAGDLDEMGARADAAIESGQWLFVLNFFQVNGVKP
jgi:ubiquinone/menaquinone biosynthesis C-methylase UbiE